MSDFETTRRAAKLAKSRRRYSTVAKRGRFGYWVGQVISYLFASAVALGLAVAIVASLRYLL